MIKGKKQENIVKKIIKKADKKLKESNQIGLGYFINTILDK